MKKFLLILCLFVGFDFLSARSLRPHEYNMKFISGSVLQMASFHIGGDFPIAHLNSGALGADKKKYGLILGGSVGWNYFEIEDDELDFGLRIKYNYTKTDYTTHSVGVISYIHPYTYPIMRGSHFIQPLSFLLGAGYSNSKAPQGHSFDGGYIEAGIALFKYFPLNLDIIYRASLYGKKNGINSSNQLTHSVSLVVNIL